MTDRARQITDAVYLALKTAGVKMPLYPAVLRRVRDLITQTGDAAMVELVCLALVTRDSADFSAGFSLNWGSFEKVKRDLEEEVPVDGWSQALWAYHLKDERRRAARDWLGLWRDAQDIGDAMEVTRVRSVFVRLMTESLDEVTL